MDAHRRGNIVVVVADADADGAVAPLGEEGIRMLPFRDDIAVVGIDVVAVVAVAVAVVVDKRNAAFVVVLLLLFPVVLRWS